MRYQHPLRFAGRAGRVGNCEVVPLPHQRRRRYGAGLGQPGLKLRTDSDDDGPDLERDIPQRRCHLRICEDHPGLGIGTDRHDLGQGQPGVYRGQGHASLGRAENDLHVLDGILADDGAVFTRLESQPCRQCRGDPVDPIEERTVGPGAFAVAIGNFLRRPVHGCPNATHQRQMVERRRGKHRVEYRIRRHRQ